MAIKMLHDNILIKVEKKEKTAAGIILPETLDENILKGIVVSTGDGYPGYYRIIEPECADDDVVYFYKNRASKIKIENEEYYVVKDIDIICIESY